MKAVLASIRPRHCIDIANNKKSLEVRKTCPKLDTPFKVYIYCTAGKPYMVYNDDSWCAGYTALNNWSEKRAKEVWELMNGKVIGEFVCDNIRRFDIPYPAYQSEMDKQILKESCLTYHQLHRYANHDDLYGWHISNLVIYDKPKPLMDFYNWKKCDSCIRSGYESSACIYDGDCKVPAIITRPPQSWCYVEEMEGGAGK